MQWPEIACTIKIYYFKSNKTRDRKFIVLLLSVTISEYKNRDTKNVINLESTIKIVK